MYKFLWICEHGTVRRNYNTDVVVNFFNQCFCPSIFLEKKIQDDKLILHVCKKHLTKQVMKCKDK